MPDPILVGRNEDKLRKLADAHGVARISTNLDEALSNPNDTVYFDAQLTQLRAPAVKKAIEAGKHVYCEKPTGVSTKEALELYQLATAAGLKNGVVQDKLFLPSLRRLKTLFDNNFFGELLSVRGEFGYWIFTGHDDIAPQRPSWNYRKEDGGGIIVDMLCHWRYVLDHLFGEVRAVSCLGKTHIEERIGEDGKPYQCTTDDAAYATFELEGGGVTQFNSSWTTRVRRDDLLTLHVDGTTGSAVAGLRHCVIQHYGATPLWSHAAPDLEPRYSQSLRLFRAVAAHAEGFPFDNGFKIQWEMFLKHVAFDTPYEFTLLEGAKGVQLAELGIESWQKRAWVDVPKLEV